MLNETALYFFGLGIIEFIIGLAFYFGKNAADDGDQILWQKGVGAGAFLCSFLTLAISGFCLASDWFGWVRYTN